MQLQHGDFKKINASIAKESALATRIIHENM
jgi:hypothetical protein